MTLHRLQSIGSLISKIDPVFAYNATVQETIKQSGFISIISGNNYLLVIPFHFKQLLAKWSNIPLNVIKILLPSKLDLCIICLNEILQAHVCPSCAFKVLRYIINNELFIIFFFSPGLFSSMSRAVYGVSSSLVWDGCSRNSVLQQEIILI